MTLLVILFGLNLFTYVIKIDIAEIMRAAQNDNIIVFLIICKKSMSQASLETNIDQ
jgi:hypothetical protein